MTTDAARIWKFIAKEGGRWTATEVARAMGSDDAQDAKDKLNGLVRSESVRRYEKEKPGDRIRFGVTLDCRIPIGVTLRDISECGIFQTEAA